MARVRLGPFLSLSLLYLYVDWPVRSDDFNLPNRYVVFPNNDVVVKSAKNCFNIIHRWHKNEFWRGQIYNHINFYIQSKPLWRNRNNNNKRNGIFVKSILYLFHSLQWNTSVSYTAVFFFAWINPLLYSFCWSLFIV